MKIINEHLIARFFPAVDTPLGSSLGWMVLALAVLGVAVILLAIRSVFSGRRRAPAYPSDDNAYAYSGETYGDSSSTGSDTSWFGGSSSWFDSDDTSSSYSDFSSSGGDFGSGGDDSSSSD
jgi:hypothetical protein